MKKRPASILSFFLTPLVVAASLSGCTYIRLNCDCDCEDGDSNVNVVLEWKSDPDTPPEGMSALFYPEDGSPYWRFELPLKGGEVALPAGIYNVMSFNNDTSTILFENQDDYGMSLITCRQARLSDSLSDEWNFRQPPRDADEEIQPVISQPDQVWAASKETFVASESYQTLTLQPARMTARYNVRVTEVTNAANVYRSGMAITGLSAGRYLSSLELIPFDATVGGKIEPDSDSSFSGTLNAFGRIKDRGKCRLWLYFYLRDGKKMAYEFDVTDIVENAPDPYNVDINITGISLPDIPVSAPDSGLDVGLDEWDTVEIELSTDSSEV